MGNKKKLKKEFKKFPQRIDNNRGFRLPGQLCLGLEESGMYFGVANGREQEYYIGMPQGADGNILIVGGSGSGKSTGIIEPTLKTWRGAICATDIKGELSRYYEEARKRNEEMRPYIVFDPTQVDGLSYDPFWWVLQDDADNRVANVMDIVRTIIPSLPNENQPFWRESEQAILAAGLLYYYECGLSFSQSLGKLLDVDLKQFIEEVNASDNLYARFILGKRFSELEDRLLADFDRGLRNKLSTLVVDEKISHAFRGEREGARCFNWSDLDRFNIFLRIPLDKTEQWGGAINLMYAQLIRYLERRPEKHTAEGQNNIQTLLLFDEFPQLGKLEMITSAVSTLRSKSVNMCLVVQSIAQLDMIYGEHARRVIFDNCQYQIFLRANDRETQKLLSDLIGTTNVLQESVSKQTNEDGKTTGYSKQRTEAREPRVFPHEFSTLQDVLLASPFGVCRVKKFQPYNSVEQTDQEADQVSMQIEVVKEEEVGKLTVFERVKNANECLKEYRREHLTANEQARERCDEIDRERKYKLGDLLLGVVPELLSIFPNDNSEDAVCLQVIEQFLKTVAQEPNVAEMVCKRFVLDTET